MAKAMLKDKECWMRHLSLDPYTGSDPPGIKVRSAQGMEAADYFAGPYWVWSKMIENMADVGYDPVNMALLPYDWRLSFPLLEERDGYLTTLKNKIEFLHKKTGEKVVLMSHSFGGSLSLYFFQWVTHSESEGGGGGGKDWLEKHVHAFVNIAGTVLGVPKAFPALLSGEMKDTSSFTGTMDRVLETFFGRKKRKDLWCKWGSLWAMLPKGGSPIWGIGADIPNSSEWPSENPIMYMINNDTIAATTRAMDCASLAATDDKAQESCSPADYVLEKILRNGYASFEDGIELLQTWGSGYGSKLSSSLRHTFRKPGETTVRGLNEKDWHNPSVMPLPYAPSMKMYCLYGIGRPTERGYVYKVNQLGLEDTEASIFHGGTFADPPIIMATNITYQDRPIKNGVLLSDGDGTVPLLSEGYMCASGWVENSKLNPSRIKTFTREYVHSVSFQYSDPGRGGPYSSEHVDILGNVATTEDILKVVTGFDDASVVDLILSDLKKISETINSHPDGGVKSDGKKKKDKRHLNIFPLAG
jgi:phospholipid:diacylglycerol acyltransferase